MGQKVNPHGARVGVIRGWNAHWIAEKKNFGSLLVEDYNLRTYLKKKYYQNSISKIEIERKSNAIVVYFYTARPGVLIGKGGSGIEVLKAEIQKLTGKQASVNIVEVKRPDADAQLVSESIAAQLEKRGSFRRAMKQAIQRAQKSGVKGIKTMVSGRLGGAEIARSEHYHEGSIPLQTLRADIEYGFAEAATTYGRIGVKVWVYKGQILPAAKKPPMIKQEGGV